MAVFAETIFIRMLFSTFLLMTLVLVTFGMIVFLRLNSTQIIPGWTSSILGILAILALQAVGILLSTIFLSILFKRNIHAPTHSISPQYISKILKVSEQNRIS
jgi:thiol:disulfide interchange protein